MKQDFHFHFYSRIVVMAVLALGIFFLQQSVNTTAQQVPNSVRLGGWAWSDTVGWISLNCRNDFDGDGLIENTCSDNGGVDYWLEVVDVSGEPYVQGCAWAGVSVDGNPDNILGWICFNDWNGYPTQAPTNGIRMNNNLVNSLCFETAGGVCNAGNSFASIANQEGQCSGGVFDGDPCNINADCTGGSCVINSDAWKLGFNVQDPVQPTDADYPSASNPIEGCFNCHIDRIAECELDASIDCSADDALCQVDELRCAGNPNIACSVDANCIVSGNDWQPCQPTAIDYGACIQTGIEEKCENCLEYFYYNEGDPDLYTNGYEHRRALTIDSDYVSGASNYNNFPVLVSLTSADLRYFTSAGDVTNQNGYDIIFTQNADGTGQLDHEIESYNPSAGTIRMWVEIPTLSVSADTVFYMFYGNDAVDTSQEDISGTGVWDANYNGVWHLGETNGNYLDSTGKNDSTSYNVSSRGVSCAVDGCPDFDGVNDYVKIPHNADNSLNPDNMTVSFWFKRVGLPDTYDVVLNKGDNNSEAAMPTSWSYNFEFDNSTNDNLWWEVNFNGWTNLSRVETGSLSDDTWYYITATYNDSSRGLEMFVNGTSVDTSTNAGARIKNNYELTFMSEGGVSPNPNFFTSGNIDEVRLSSVVRSDDYIITEFNNQKYPNNFISIGADDPRAIGGLKYVIGGYSCEQCNIEDLNNTCGTNPYNSNINRCETCTDGVYYTPGLMIDHKYNNIKSITDQLAEGCNMTQLDPDASDYCEVGYMCGWGWNAWQESGNLQGLGWFQFGPRINTSTKPYFTADEGSIYSRGDVFSRYNAPFGRYNASYLIEAGGSIINVVSSTTLADMYQGELPDRPLLDFFNIDSTNNKYKNALGTIDYLGLTKVSYQASGDYYNKYGSKIITDPVAVSFSNPLDGAVIYFTSDLTVNNDLVLPVGTGSGQSLQKGSGVMVVDGDLHFNANVEYGPINNPINFNLKHIPSLVWVVKGDITVSPDVTNLAGTFIALGSSGLSGSCTPHSVNDEISHCIDEPYNQVADADHMCGQFVSCYDDGTATANCSTNQLSVSGNVIARQFDLCRSYIDVSKVPAELFTNDGRLQANPPPGFVDFSKVIPRFSENLR